MEDKNRTEKQKGNKKFKIFIKAGTAFIVGAVTFIIMLLTTDYGTISNRIGIITKWFGTNIVLIIAVIIGIILIAGIIFFIIHFGKSAWEYQGRFNYPSTMSSTVTISYDLVSTKAIPDEGNLCKDITCRIYDVYKRKSIIILKWLHLFKRRFVTGYKKGKYMGIEYNQNSVPQNNSNYIYIEVGSNYIYDVNHKGAMRWLYNYSVYKTIPIYAKTNITMRHASIRHQ